MRSTKSLQYLYASIGIIIFMATFIGLYYFAANILHTKQEEILFLELKNTEKEIETSFQTIETTIMNTQTLILNNPTEAFLLDYFIDIHAQNPLIASLYFGRPDNTMVNSTGFKPPEGFDLTTRIWYQEAISQTGIVYTNAFINATNDRIIVTMAYAIYDGQTLLGVIAADIDVKTISMLVGDKQVGDNGYAFLIDQNNQVIGHPDLIATEIALYDLADFDMAFLAENNIQLFVIHEHDEFVLAMNEISNGTYRLGLLLPKTEFYGQSTLFTLGFSLLVSFLLGFVVLFMYLHHTYVQKPLDKIIIDIDQIDILQNRSYRLPQSSKDTFLPMRQSINTLLDAFSAVFNQNSKAQEALWFQHQKILRLMASNAEIVFEIDRNKKFVSIFGKGLETLGLTASDVIGKDVVDLFNEDGKQRNKYYDRVLKGEVVSYQWDNQYLGKTHYYASTVSPIYDADDTIVGAVGVTRNITEQYEKQKHIEYISFHDYLTGLYNRRYFSETLAKMDVEAYYPLGIMMIDVNGLKLLNDAFGHAVGDVALKQIATLLSTQAYTNSVVSRIGGDEFSVVLPKASIEKMDDLKNRLLKEIQHVRVQNITLSISIGYELKHDFETPIQTVLNDAENFMYRQKIIGGKGARSNAIQMILKTLNNKFQMEKEHADNVSKYCRKIGEAMNFSTDDLRELEMAGLYHDIGKISVPDDLLKKPGKLTNEEMAIMRTHTENGYQILRAADEYSSLAEDALCHHEHFDGNGYPNQLKGEEIPLFSRIISVADAYDSMMSDRPYRKAMSQGHAIQELLTYSGTQFDPKIVDVFVAKVLKYSH